MPVNLNVGCPSDRVQSGTFGAVMLAPVDAVTDADPVGPPRCDKTDIAAQTTASDRLHAAPPPGSMARIEGVVDQWRRVRVPSSFTSP
ncbi:MAG: tRNA-dihydrouridine synthase [Hydrogenophaga sp.]|nr:tRNA-dihydrouridine synthase [Hydrogenophaga sp.]